MAGEVYQCLVAGLPDLVFDQGKLTLSWEGFREELENNLTPVDFRLAQLFFLPYDISNLLNILNKSEEEDEGFVNRGNFSKEQLEEFADTKEIETPIDIASNLNEFIEKLVIHFKNDIPLYNNMDWNNQFTNYYYAFCLAQKNNFVRKWFEFEMNIKNIQVAINASNHEKEVEKELVGDNEVVDAILNERSKDFGLGNDYSYVEKILNLYENKDLLTREKEVDLIKWNKVDELNTFNYFSIEVLLGYLIKLNIVERWIKLDKETGKEMFERLMHDLQHDYEFPQEFKEYVQ